MKDLRNNQLTDLQDNIKEMRLIMEISSPAIRFIYSAKVISPVFLITGIWATIYSLIFHRLLLVYHSYSLIPSLAIISYYGTLIISLIGILIFRTYATLKVGRTLDEKLNIWGLIKKLLSTRLMLLVFPVLAVLIIIPFKVIEHWVPTDVLPYMAIVLGTILNIFGVIIRNVEYSISGYYFIITGVLGLIFIVIPVHIAFGAIFAPGCFLFVIIEYVRRKKQ